CGPTSRPIPTSPNGCSWSASAASGDGRGLRSLSRATRATGLRMGASFPHFSHPLQPRPTTKADMQDQTRPPTRGSSFHRSIGLFTGTAINMTQMCGIGPFITIPIMVATMGGPQAVIGWIVGAILAVADGMVWAELGAAMPGSGGTYVYLREAFQYRTG